VETVLFLFLGIAALAALGALAAWFGVDSRDQITDTRTGTCPTC
jgi:hypothetical protein